MASTVGIPVLDFSQGEALLSIPEQKAKQIWENVYAKRYFRKCEVLAHCEQHDFWIILYGRVLNLSDLIKNELAAGNKKDRQAIKMLLRFGGENIDDVFATKHLVFNGMFTIKSQSSYGLSNDLYWWNDPTYIIGKVTLCERTVYVIEEKEGKLTKGQTFCCEEDSLYRIRERYYAKYPNSDSDQFIWNNLSAPFLRLQLDKTLKQNGLIFDPDDRVVFIWSLFENRYTYKSKTHYLY